MWVGCRFCTHGRIFGSALFAFALSSMVFGQVPTFFFGMITFFALQGFGSLFRFGVEHVYNATDGFWYWGPRVYRLLPPVGEVVFDLKEGFNKSFESYEHFWLWGVWLVIFVLLFRLKLRYPSSTRSTEG